MRLRSQETCMWSTNSLLRSWVPRSCWQTTHIRESDKRCRHVLWQLRQLFSHVCQELPVGIKDEAVSCEIASCVVKPCTNMYWPWWSFVVKYISCLLFSWFAQTMKIFLQQKFSDFCIKMEHSASLVIWISIICHFNYPNVKFQKPHPHLQKPHVAVIAKSCKTASDIRT